MSPRFCCSVLVCISLALTAQVGAQLPVPLLHSVFPPGAQAGTTVEVDLRGYFLEGATGLTFSDASLGITTEAIPDMDMPEYTTRFRLKIPREAKPGIYDLFAKCKLGLSTPRPFVIGDVPEVVEPEYNGNRERALALKTGLVINGQASENANDVYRIEAKAGEKFVITCRAQDLDSRMDATLVLYNSVGRELDRDRNNRDRNAVVALNAPKDGTYYVHVADFTYGGGDGYPYRLSMTTAPHLEFAFPLAAQPGTTAKFIIYGRNLPGSDPAKKVLVGNRFLETQEIEFTLPADAVTTGMAGNIHAALLRHVPYRLKAGETTSNDIPIGVAASPVVLEQEAGTGPDQEVNIPCEVHGRFDRGRDQDRFRFTATKDQQLWVEVISERIGASADPILKVERVTKADDGSEQFQAVGNGDDLSNNPGERLFPLPCRDADLSLKIPEDGQYRVSIMNQTGSGGLDQVYRLVLREPKPDYDLIAVPWQRFPVKNQVDVQSPILRPGGSVDFRILALRHEGFAGEIELTAADLPEGVTCSPVEMGAARSAMLTLTAGPDAKPWDGMIVIKGVSGERTRTALLGAVPWSVNDWSKQYFETRLGPRIPLCILAGEKAPVSVQVTGEQKFEIVVGQKFDLPIGLTRNLPNTGEFVLRCEGLPHKTGELKLTGGTEKGSLVVASGNPNEFPKEPGTWTFRIRAEGTMKYQTSKATLDYVRATHKRFAEGRKKTAAHIEQLISARDKALQELDALVEGNSQDDPSTAAKAETVRAQLAKIAGEVQMAEEKARDLDVAVLRAAAEIKSTVELVKDRDVKVVAYSAPITVTVGPAPEK